MTSVQEAKTRGWHGVEVLLKNDSLVEVPHCPHGKHTFADGTLNAPYERRSYVDIIPWKMHPYEFYSRVEKYQKTYE